jgi:hypothetical protein
MIDGGIYINWRKIMLIKDLINELKKYDENQNVFINTTNDKTFEISDISLNCDNDYPDTLLIIDTSI